MRNEVAAISVKPQKSREHHWWPVGLQKHWTDSSGNVSWIDPDGVVARKKAANRKIAKKAHGHTIQLDGPWTTNFEADFEGADDGANNTLQCLLAYKAKGGASFADFLSLLALLFTQDKTLSDLCRYYEMDTELADSLALLIISLLIRLPSRRHSYEQTPNIFGFPPDPNVGKANMRQFFYIARSLLKTGAARRMFFLLIRSPVKEFIYGDGALDWLSDNLIGYRISGRALLPLTPKLCVYICTPSTRVGRSNCASFYAAPWVVDAINEITQIYSRDFLFFRKKPPTLTKHFKSRNFLSHDVQRDHLIDMLDAVASRNPGTGVRKREVSPLVR